MFELTPNVEKLAKKYLQNIRASDKNLRGNCNAGAAMSEERGDYRDISILFMEHGIANIVSMSFLEKEGYKISYETGVT